MGQGKSAVSFQFGEFELDAAACELRREDRKVRLQDKPRQLLTLLLEDRGKLVTRDVLQEELWPAGTHVDREHGLNAAIRKLRQALGENATRPRFIETVPRQGYRFFAPVITRGTEASAPTLLAVLPLQSLHEDSSQAYFAEGLTEELVTRLGRLDPGRLNVIAHSSVRKYAGRPLDVEVIAEELGVDLCLEGSARRESGQVRISLHLVRATDQVVIWSNSYEAGASDLMSIQRDVSSQVADALQLKLLTPTDLPAPEPEAHDAFLRGYSCWNQRTPDALGEALRLFRQATERAPRFAVAFAALAECYNLLEDYGVDAPERAFPLARAAATRALELDASLPQAHTALAFVRHRFEWDWEQAELAYRRAIELNPSSSYAHHRYAEFLSQLLRHDEALAAIARARRVDPFSSALSAVEAWILFHAGRYDQAAHVCRAVLDAAPRFAVARFVLGRALAQGDAPEAALESYKHAAADAPDNAFVLAGLGVIAARLGDDALCDEALGNLKRLGRERFVSPFLIGKVHAARGHHDLALRRLQEAVRMRSGWVVDLAVDPELNDLRQRSDYMALLKTVGLPTVVR